MTWRCLTIACRAPIPLVPPGSQTGVWLRRHCLCVLGMIAVLLAGVGSSSAQAPASPTGEITVFAASSLTEPFTAIGRRLQAAHPGFKIRFNFGGSPTLRTQLEQGARADVYASADAAQMELAKKSGVIQGETPLFVKNRLVVIVPRSNPGNITTLQDLARPGVKLDLAAPTVPVGHYSRQVLSNASAAYGADFAERALRNMVSEEENVKQVVTKVQLGEADAGIVYVSDVTPKVSNDVVMIPIPNALNETAAYPIALTQAVRNRPAAEFFISFVLSAAGQALLKAHNFIPVQEE